MTRSLLQKALAALVAAALLAGPAVAAPRPGCEGARLHPCCKRLAGEDAAVKRAPCCALQSPSRSDPASAAPRAAGAEAPAFTALPPPSRPGFARVAAAAALPAGLAGPGHGPPVHLRTCVFLL